MRHRKWRWLWAFLLSACVLAQGAPTARADDPAQDLMRAQERQKQIQRDSQNAKGVLAQVFWQTEETKAQLQTVESELALSNSKLVVIGVQLKDTQAELARVESTLHETIKRYQGRKTLMGRRLRVINEQGRVSFLGVLFRANSFSDFISRFDMLKLIVKADSELLGLIRADRLALEEQQQAVTTRKAKFTELQVAEQENKRVVEGKQVELQQLTVTLSQRRKQLQAQLEEYTRQAVAIENEIYEIQVRLNRKAGTFVPVNPLRGARVITSWFGNRVHPVFGGQSYHGGIDLDASYGTPIYAIEDGMIIHAGWDSVYGNRLVIDHGGGISSWYGHASELVVGVNTEVKRGQVIAKVGSTGLSTGPHLHLEIRVNNVRQDPLKYLPK